MLDHCLYFQVTFSIIRVARSFTLAQEGPLSFPLSVWDHGQKHELDNDNCHCYSSMWS